MTNRFCILGKTSRQEDALCWREGVGEGEGEGEWSVLAASGTQRPWLLLLLELDSVGQGKGMNNDDYGLRRPSKLFLSFTYRGTNNNFYKVADGLCC